jgi:hypothetical protein
MPIATAALTVEAATTKPCEGNVSRIELGCSDEVEVLFCE